MIAALLEMRRRRGDHRLRRSEEAPLLEPPPPVPPGTLRKQKKSFRPRERPPPMSTKEAEARLVPDSHGVEVLDSGDGKLIDPLRDSEELSSQTLRPAGAPRP